MSQNKGFSILLCCYNSVSRLRPTLEHLAALQIPSGFEVELLLIDNASTDNTADFAIMQWQKLSSPFALKLYKERKPGLSAARAKGFQCASFEYMLMCDDDNWLQSDYLMQAAPILENPNIAGLGGLGKPKADVPLPDWFAQFAKSFALGPQAPMTGPVTRKRSYLYGAGCIFRKAAIEEVFTKGFQSRLQDREGKSYSSGGDVELCYAVKLAGYELWYCDKMIFNHYLPDKRLVWNDFVKLKIGITSSYGPFLCYNFLLKKNKTSFLFFLNYYFRQIRAKFICIYQYKSAKRQPISVNDINMKSYLIEALICRQQLKILLQNPLKIWKDFFYVSKFSKAVKSLK